MSTELADVGGFEELFAWTKGAASLAAIFLVLFGEVGPLFDFFAAIFAKVFDPFGLVKIVCFVHSKTLS